MHFTLPYTVLDVFAERPLEGNPLMVFHDARGLSTAQMQALARETNLSETTFVLPANDPADDLRDGVRVRIFTTEEELPFAGHPTLGTASWLRLHHPALCGADTVMLRLDAGAIPVHFPEPDTPGTALGAAQWGSMRQNDPVFGASYDPAEIAAVLGVTPADLLPGYRPQTVSTGNAFCLVAFASTDSLSRLAIPQREATQWLRSHGARWFYCIAPEPAIGGWRARMQWHAGEDPATGSAAGPCIAWLVAQGLAASGQAVELRQGLEMHRPSRLVVKATRTARGITDVHVAGRTIPVAAGEFVPGDAQAYAQRREPESPTAARVP